MDARKPISRIWASIALAVTITITLSLVFGPRGLAFGVVTSFLMLSWRHDNSAGLLFPLAMLVAITIGVLLLLMYLMARVHS
ncbi:hypothetical protein WSK_0526 [Novosphingobium sp. Rr 2-17]|nr:hypothetical protein WSK_0526 [Novosphingobium sp. Rr 2-17]